jgi:hypothetical protein
MIVNCIEKLTGLAASVIFKIPVVRELFLSMGYIDADRKAASRALSIGRSLFICIGGAAESLWCNLTSFH